MDDSNQNPPSKKKKKVFMRKRNNNGWGNNKASPMLVPPVNPQVNLELEPNQFCPYKTWRHYFPFEDYSAQSDSANNINVFLCYMESYFSHHDISNVGQSGCIHLDCKELSSHPAVAQQLPNFMEILHDSPENMISCIGLAAHHFIRQFYKNQMTNSTDVSKTQLFQALADVPIIRARLFNFDAVTALKNLKARQVGKFVTVRGTLVKVSNVKPVCTTMAFRCVQCHRIQALLLIDCKYMTPSRCMSERCKCSRFEALREHPLTEITDWQTIKLQEKLSDDQREAGRMPRTIEVELSRDLTDTASPGDVVTITGVVKVMNSDDGKLLKNSKNNSMYLLYIEGNHVVNARSSGGMGGDRRRAAEENLDFSASDIEGIENVSRQVEVFSLLTCSLCPTIYGHNMVKAGLLLCMFGGSQKDVVDMNRIPVRTNSHILLVGDPGLGKSQLLQAVSRLAPRGVYVCGNTSSNSGLTVTLTRDTGSGDTGLEAGALVLADQGICCIDEFDKMNQQHQALLEAMEQQSISIAKGGVVCSMPARCSVVAAANPIKGHYNKSKTVSENLKMSGPLLSRFDLVYILLDTPNQQKDKLLSDHVMALHTGQKNRERLNRQLAAITCNLSQESMDRMGSLELRLNNYSSEGDYDPVPHALMWRYIAYARKTVNNITLSSEACKVLKEFYLELRAKGRYSDTTPITTRQLESMKRLTEARCRAELRTEATAEDASEVVEIMRYSLYNTYADEHNNLHFDRSMHGSGVSRNKKVKNLLAVLNRESQQKTKNLFNITEIRELAGVTGIPPPEVGEIVESLNDKGFLIKTGASLYKLQSGF